MNIPPKGAPGYGAATTDPRTKRYRCACGAETPPLTAAEPLPDGWRVMSRRTRHGVENFDYQCPSCAGQEVVR